MTPKILLSNSMLYYLAVNNHWLKCVFMTHALKHMSEYHYLKRKKNWFLSILQVDLRVTMYAVALTELLIHIMLNVGQQSSQKL